MENFRSNKAITLIALVITIVILIILAAISLNILLGDNGLIEKTKWSAFTSDLAKVQESVMLTQKIEDNGTMHIDEEKAFDGQYDGTNISDGLKKSIVLVRQGNLDSEISNEEVNTKYEELKGEDGKITNLYYVKSSIAKKDKEYLYDTETNTVLRVSATKIFSKDYYLYKIGDCSGKGSAVSSLNITKPNGPDLSNHKGLEPNWIPIYTVEQYAKIATGEQNYDIYNKAGTKVGTYNMDNNLNYRLMNDLDFTSIEADSIKGFKGTFDGNGYYIKNITINKSTSTDEYYYYSTDDLKTGDVSELKVGVPAGLFDRIECGTVENLGVDNANITGVANVGVISGEVIQTNIQNCLIKNSSATSNGATNSGAVGGLVGWSYKKDTPTTLNTIKMDNVDVKGASVTSGLIAVSTSDISVTACSVENSTIDMQATQSSYYESQGGILGFATANVTIDNCYTGKTTLKNNLAEATSYNNSCGGILGGTYYNSQAAGTKKITINNSSIEDSELAIAKNNGGIVGFDCHVLTITNCNAQNLKTSGHTTGGIIGFDMSGKDITIKNCNVNKLMTNEKFNLGQYAYDINIGGIAGYMLYLNGNSEISKCNVTNSMIVFDNCTNVSNTCISGILGGDMYCSGPTNKIEECNVENTTVQLKMETVGLRCHASGIAGIGGHDIKNCNVKDSKISLESKNPTINYDSVGDISGPSSTGILASNINGDRDNTISGCEIINTEISTNIAQAFGICQYAYKGLNITNCSVEKSVIAGKVTTAGVLGTHYTSTVNIDTIDIKDTTIVSEIRHAAGIMYYAYNNKVTLNKCNVDNCTIKNLRYEESNGMSSSYKKYAGNVSGIMGYSYGCNITNCNVDDTKLTGNYMNTAGIVSFTSGTVTLDNCNVNNATIVANGQNAGGICASASWGTTINNCTVDGGSITSNDINVGGIVGVDTSDTIIKECKVKNLSIDTESSLVGGISGVASIKELTNCSVENVNINAAGKYVGGLIGCAYNINDSGITNCDVTSSKIIAENHDVGGLFGYCNNYSKISLCDVTSTEISGKDVGVGGIVGEYTSSAYNGTCNADISNCTVKDSKVTITGTDSKAVGGIVGNGTNIKNYAAVIDTCTVSGTEITGVDYVGGISGVASTNIKDCTVKDNSKITGRNCVGGIQGFGGIHGKLNVSYDMNNSSTGTFNTYTYEQEISVITNITGCQVNNSTLTGTTDVNYIQGKNSYFVEGWTGDTAEDTITNSTYNSVTLNTNV